MTWWAVGAAVVEIAVTAVGTGISYYGQQQQAKNEQSIAFYNAAIQRNNANINAKVAQQQATLNQAIANSNAQAHDNTAQTYANQATAVENQAMEEASVMRDRNRRFLATQENRSAASGIVGTEGTPLVDLAASASNLEMGVANTLYEGDLNAKSWQQRGKDEKYQAGFSLLDASVAQYHERAAAVGRTVQMDTIAGDLAAGENRAAGTTLASYGTLLSGAGQVASQTYQAQQGGAFGNKSLLY
jgi:hypothetical protein